MLVAWFKDATNGVAVHMAAVPRYAADEAPPTIPSANIIEESSNNSVAVGMFPEGDGPFLQVALVRGDEMPDQAVNDVGDGTLALDVRYLTRNVEAADAKADAGYTLRGAIWSLRRLHGEAGRTTMDDQNDIQFYQASPIEFIGSIVPLGEGFVVGWLRIQYRYRDNGLSGG